MNEQTQAAWTALERRIGHCFADRALLVQALTHRSFANESRNPESVDNERLEFLGDAVLDLVIGHLLLERHPDAAEGELSRLRAELVSAPSLARLAAALEVGDCLLLGRGEARSGGRAKDNLLADGLEALLGAVFVDAGYQAVAAVIGRLFEALLSSPASAVGVDYKTRLQELLQARRERPDYRVAAASGPDHRRSYVVEVLVGGDVLGRGEGTTKKRAEQEAARQALAMLAGEGTADD